MSSPEPRSLPVAHAERTADPEVLRWVVHEPSLPAAPCTLEPPAGSLLSCAPITGVRRAGGDLYVRVAGAGEWSALAAAIDSAVREALAGRADWLFATRGDDECDHDWVAVVQAPSAQQPGGCTGCSHANGCGAVAQPISRRVLRGG